MSFLRKKSRGHGEEIKSFLQPHKNWNCLPIFYILTHTVCFCDTERVGAVGFYITRFLFFWILEGIEQPKAVLSRVEQSRIGLRGVFQCCVTCEWRLQVKRTDYSLSSTII
jgi:hypothetical protein